jgi:hypothetical protein
MTSPRKGNTPLQMDIHPCGADVARTRRTVTPEFMTVANGHGTEHGAQSPWSPGRTDSASPETASDNDPPMSSPVGTPPGDDPVQGVGRRRTGEG